MFNPTHVLVSRSRQIPVQLVPGSEGVALMTEQDWQTQAEPAFVLHPKRGFFCLGIQVVGYSLQPMNSEFDCQAAAPNAGVTEAQASSSTSSSTSTGTKASAGSQTDAAKTKAIKSGRSSMATHAST